MKSTKFLLLAWFICNIHFLNSQLYNISTEPYPFFDGSSDILLFEGGKYLLEKTPLNVFPGYDKIYPELPDVAIEILPGYGSMDKDYEVEWLLIDSVLYMTNIRFEYCLGLDPEKAKEFFPNDEQFIRMEKLTQRKFEKYKYLKGFTYIPNPYGVIEGDWISGVYYIKKPMNINEPKENWYLAPSYRLEFEKGKLISLTKAYKIPNAELLPDKSE